MTSSSRPPSEEIIDWEQALDRVDGSEETLVELVEIFLEQWPEMMDEIEQGVARADYENLRRAAHTLKGSASIFGARPVVEVADRLSDMARDEELDGAEGELRTLQDEMDRLVPVMQKRMH
jgi:HPt (histidine-containing phosphotransfer) domain-containing protein